MMRLECARGRQGREALQWGGVRALDYAQLPKRVACTAQLLLAKLAGALDPSGFSLIRSFVPRTASKGRVLVRNPAKWQAHDVG